jgi:small-conductance mechanosensitive channel
LLGAGVAFGAKRALGRVLPNGKRSSAKFDWPIAAVATALIILVVVEWGLSLPSPIASVIDPLAMIALAASVAWLIMRALGVAIDRLAKDAVRKLHDEDSSAQRRVLTQLTVARHAMMLIVALIALGIVMLQLDTFRTFGMALLSSAGAAAVILGLAGHAVLGNLIAGLQIALTQPFTLGDTVYIENQWGKIEDIAYTFVVVRTWDERRVVFPIKYFIGHWFENWSMTDPYLIQAIYLHVDYRADVEKIRRKFIELVEADEDWDSDRNEPEVLVTETREETMVVRLTCGGASPSDAWSLHCRVREKLVAWLQEVEDGAYLPSRRVILRDSPARDGGAGA